jgi:hypothetical protein
MPQQRREVTLLLLSGEKRTGIATGNNAAWHCVCSGKTLLIGRSEESKNMAVSSRVDCPSCQRQYYVISVGPKLGAVREIIEVSRDVEASVPNPSPDDFEEYGTTHGVLKPFSQVQLPDGRWAHLIMHTEKGERAFALADLHERLASWPLSSAVPETVKVQFETAKNAMLYAWFVFEFQSLAEMQAYAALELALRMRLGNPTRSPGKASKPKPLTLFNLVSQAVAAGLIVPEKLPAWEWVKTRREHHARMTGVPLAPFPATEWLQRMKDLLPDLRNFLAHGNFKRIFTIHSRSWSFVATLSTSFFSRFDEPLYEPLRSPVPTSKNLG